MKTIIGNIRRGMKTLSYLLAAFFALAAVQSAQAKHFSWVGSADATSDWKTLSC